MGSALTTIGLPLALGIIMLGLGLTLTPADFARVVKHPRAVVIALGCQLLVLPALCFALVLAFKLPPILAIGMILLAASPGGTTANLYSHLFRGDVALNISLTAVNSVLAVVTLPLITNLAIGYFAPDQPGLGLQVAKALEVFAIVLGPVAIGMALRRVNPAFADAMDKPVRIASVVILAVVIAGAVAANFELLRVHVSSLATITVLFCIASLLVGYFVPRLFGVKEAQARACSFEIADSQRDARDRARPDGHRQHGDVPARRGVRGADVLHRPRLRIPPAPAKPGRVGPASNGSTPALAAYGRLAG